MLKKLLCLFIILIISTLFLNTTYAIDVVMNLNNTTNTDTQTIDNTLYSSNTDAEDSTIDNYEQVATTTTTDYDESPELSISNIINIVLISVGIVLILLGIAIIIKLK